MSERPITAASPAAVHRGKPHLPGELGIWFFVAGDLIVFTLFFIVIAVGNRDHAELFAQSRAALEMWVGVVNSKRSIDDV